MKKVWLILGVVVAIVVLGTGIMETAERQEVSSAASGCWARFK